jgi:hypothetical protein
MIDFDPRDYDSRDANRSGLERSRGSRGSSDTPRDREHDPRDVFMRDLNLPRGPDREVVHDSRGREYTLRGSESRTLSTVGSFRVVAASRLRDQSGRPADPRHGDLGHLREQGLIETRRLDGRRDSAVVLTDRGRDVLEASREPGRRPHQQFYAGFKREPELEHDVQIYDAFLTSAERLAERDARIERIVLDYELKREYQRWLHERDRDRDDCDGRPDRAAHEIQQWAAAHELPYFDDQVHFPDLRIDYEELDGRHLREDIEVVTVHYRGGHGAAVSRSGFSCYGGFTARLSGRSGGRGCGHGRSAAEELWD